MVHSRHQSALRGHDRRSDLKNDLRNMKREKYMERTKEQSEINFAIDIADNHIDLDFLEGKWKLRIIDISEGIPEITEITKEINTIEASAVMCLMIGYGEEDLANLLITKEFYEIAEKVFENVPQNLRIIP